MMDHAEEPMVVLHVDLDCFYAAVEQVRLGIPKEKPLAVQQWEGLIAVNYPARAAGVVRHDRISEALKKCPDLVRVHVETIGGEGGSEASVDRKSSKVSLERYRQASASVFAIFQRFSDVCEKASIDEAYLDVTATVEEMVDEDHNWDQELHRLVEGDTMVVMEGPLVPCNSFDRRLLAGAILADRLRAAVRNELGYTCSVGIATNKLLAKIASGRNKPDRQTLIPPRGVPGLMKDLPLKKIKLLGGKLGLDLHQKWGCTTAGEVQDVPLSALVNKFGERLGTYVWKAVRGAQTSKVETKQISKSMLAAKSFAATSDFSEIQRWLHILAEELSVRVLRDAVEHHRKPKILQLYFRSGQGYASDRSKSCPMPQAALHILSSAIRHPPSSADAEVPEKRESLPQEVCEDHPSSVSESVDDMLHVQGVTGAVNDTSKALAKVFEDAGLKIFHRIEDSLPCHRLALAASGFQQSVAEGSQSIDHFFSASTSSFPDNDHQLDKVEERVQTTPTKVPSSKPKGILKYVTTGKGATASSLQAGPDSLSSEHSAPKSAGEADNVTGDSAYLLSREDDAARGEGDDSMDTVDIGNVDVEEQRRILERIRKLKEGNRKHPRNPKPVRDLKRHPPKRAQFRELAENRQDPITKFFQTHIN